MHWNELLLGLCAFPFVTHVHFVCRTRRLPGKTMDWSGSHKSIKRSSCCVLGESD